MNDNIINQNITLNNRKDLNITGILRIISYNNNEFQLISNLGNITVLGKNLELVNYDSTNKIVKIKGNIVSITYSDKKQKKESFITKLFK